jgi:hypothetical protein
LLIPQNVEAGDHILGVGLRGSHLRAGNFTQSNLLSEVYLFKNDVDMRTEKLVIFGISLFSLHVFWSANYQGCQIVRILNDQQIYKCR